MSRPRTVAPFAWYGGKSRMAAKIVELLPAHRTYVEAFGGAGAVLCSKQPATLEVYNDVDSGLVTFFRVLRDRPDDLERALLLTPYSREEFAHCVRTWADVQDDLERARRWYVRCRQAFAGSSATVGWGFECTGDTRGGTRSGSFATAVDNLYRFAERFRRVQVDNLDWQACLARYDSPTTCWYLDPPYHPDTRAPSGRLEKHSQYVHELSSEQHEALVSAVVGLQGSVLVSGYDHDSYAPLVTAGFERLAFSGHSTASRNVSGRGPRTEVVWRRLGPGAHDAPPLWSESERMGAAA